MAKEKKDQGTTKTFKEFWAFYLKEHDNPVTRAVHVLGTPIGLAATAVAAVTVSPLLIPVGIAAIYGVLTASHLIFQGNIPASFQKAPIKDIGRNILFGAMSDLRMTTLWFTGRITNEYKRLGLNPHGPKRKKAPKAPKASKAAPASAPAVTEAPTVLSDATAQADFQKAAAANDDAAPAAPVPAAKPAVQPPAP